MVSSVNPSFAASLYAKASSAVTGGESSGETDSASGSSGGVSFSGFLKNQISDSMETLKSSEKLSAQAITGDVDLSTLVQSATAAELTLDTAIAVRDKMIGAYQDIMRMPI